MATHALRSLWAEPRPTNAPDPGPRDWALVAALIGWSVAEVVLRRDLAPGPVLLLYALAVIGTVFALIVLEGYRWVERFLSTGNENGE